jgi:predicted Zn finger-like uncharacterized protein
MNVTCPRCAARYDVDATVLGTAPRTVECSACGWQWVHVPEESHSDAAEETTSPAKAHAIDEAAAGFSEVMALAREAVAVNAEQEATPPSIPRPDGTMPRAASAEVAASTTKRPSPAAVAEDDFEIELSSVEPETVATETNAAEPLPPPTPPSRIPRWVVAVIAALATVAVLSAAFLAGRSLILAAMPETASLYRMFGVAVDAVGAGLEIGDVTSTREWANGEEALIVSGNITNKTAGPLPVPALKVALYGEGDEPLQSVVVAPVDKVLLAGKSTAFHARIAQPQESAQRIKIMFEAHTAAP